jgi:hypothetical protein
MTEPPRMRENRTMTERKPPFVNFETWVEKQIREAAERGEFDNLPGAGKPIPDLDKPYDEMWWIKQKVRREGLSLEAALPTPLQLRKEIDRLPDTVRDLPSEQAVRDVVDELNLRIVDWLRAPSGPRVPVGRVNVENVVAQWREARATSAPREVPVVPTDHATPDRPMTGRRRWWRRIIRRRGKSG